MLVKSLFVKMSLVKVVVVCLVFCALYPEYGEPFDEQITEEDAQNLQTALLIQSTSNSKDNFDNLLVSVSFSQKRSLAILKNVILLSADHDPGKPSEGIQRKP